MKFHFSILLFFSLVFLLNSSVVGQYNDTYLLNNGFMKRDTIEIKRTLIWPFFIQNGEWLLNKSLLQLTVPYPEAHKVIVKARRNYTPAIVFGILGLIGMIKPIEGAESFEKINWSIVGVGAGLMAVSITFGRSYNKHTLNGVRLYNNLY